MAGTRRQERAVLTANQYARGDIEGLSDYGTRRLVASTVLTESNGGELAITNGAGYIGRYQAGATWLADAGYVDTTRLRAAMAGYRREWTWAESGGMTRFLEDSNNWKDGLSLEKYKASAELQDEAFKRNSDAAYRTAMKQGVLREGDTEEHIAGFLKARHIAGYGGAVNVVRGLAAAKDDYGTSSYDYYNDIAVNRDGLNELLIVEEKFKGIPYRLPTNKELKPGDANSSVKILQENLKLVGATNGRGDAIRPDGDYGNNTREAVTQFQRQNNLPETGSADVTTLALLRTRAAAISATPDFEKVVQTFQPAGHRNDWLQTNQQGLPNYLQSQSPAATPPVRDAMADGALKIGERGPEVAKLQESLIHLGINDRVKNPIKADGIFGPDTQRAVQAFQLWHGAEQVSGVADRHTITAINTQVGLAVVQRVSDQATGQATLDFATNASLGSRIDLAAAAEPRGTNPLEAAASGTNTAHRSRLSPTTPEKKEPDTTTSISQLPPNDQAMFAKIRQSVSPQITDEKVAEAMLLAKRNGMDDASHIGPVGVVDGKLWIGGSVPGYHVGTSVSESAPSLSETLRETQSFNTQREQQLAQNPPQQQPEEINRRD